MLNFYMLDCFLVKRIGVKRQWQVEYTLLDSAEMRIPSELGAADRVRTRA